ncbi:MAG: hypothetical protein NTW59_03890 [Candidatus Diapherotrites archaeon]|nr:hypothetical protein [Candidatus Diapherotrites archaeon]
MDGVVLVFERYGKVSVEYPANARKSAWQARVENYFWNVCFFALVSKRQTNAFVVEANDCF